LFAAEWKGDGIEGELWDKIKGKDLGVALSDSGRLTFLFFTEQEQQQEQGQGQQRHTRRFVKVRDIELASLDPNYRDVGSHLAIDPMYDP